MPVWTERVRPGDPETPPSEDTPLHAENRGPDVLDSNSAGGLLVRGGALRFAGYMAMMGLSVVMSAVLTRYLGVSRFGQYTTIMSLVAVVAAVTDAGMLNLGTREYAVLQGRDRQNFLRDLLGLRITMTLLGAGVTTLFAALIGYPSALIAGALTASLATVALVLQHTLSIPLGADLRLGLLAGLELIRQTLWVGAIVVLAALGANVFVLLSVPVVANLILIWPTAVLVRGRITAGVAIRPRAWMPILQAAIVFSLATAVGTIYIYAGQILTSLATTRHEAGIFAVSFRVFAVTANVPGLLAASALPLLARAARDDRDRLAYALQRIFEVSLIGGLGLAIVMSAASGFIVSVVAGPRYASAGSVLSLQVFAMVDSFVLAGWSFALLSLRLHRQLLLANGAALIVSTVGTLVLAANYGATGAAVATLCAETTLAVATLVALVWRRPRYRPRLAIVPRVILVGGFSAAVAMAPDMPSALRGLVAAVVYTLGIVAVRAAPPELWLLVPWRRISR
jgi:O-antigen/teichoic acid export membrane protein